MKKLFVILLVCVMSSLFAVKPDKILHFGACAGVTFTATTVERYYGVETNRAIWDGAVWGMAIGVAKEIDDLSAGGEFSLDDLRADMYGVGFGTLINLALKKSRICYKKLDIYARCNSFGFVIKL